MFLGFFIEIKGLDLEFLSKLALDSGLGQWRVSFWSFWVDFWVAATVTMAEGHRNLGLHEPRRWSPRTSVAFLGFF